MVSEGIYADERNAANKGYYEIRPSSVEWRYGHQLVRL
jgi:hypothetical protein